MVRMRHVCLWECHVSMNMVFNVASTMGRDRGLDTGR